MKIKIEYEYDVKYCTKYWAKTYVDEKLILEGSLSSFAEARKKLITAVGLYLREPVLPAPPPEEVEIEEAIHANQ
jgi:hypothetical protein